MKELPTNRDARLPDGLTLEKPARNLASLATTQALIDLRRLVLAQWKHADIFSELARYGIRPVDRLLFFGPPGNGKTMASQWLAKEIDVPLYRVRCETLVNAYMGQTAANIGAVMEWLEKQSQCVVLLDEVETLFSARTEMGGKIGREFNSAMSVFWQYLDRWESPTLFVLATNLRDRLDPALLSRIDVQMEFGPPTPDQASAVAQYWAEVLHEYGGNEWGPIVDDGRKWESFRALFQSIQAHVREFVSQES